MILGMIAAASIALRGDRGFASPSACVNAYYQAVANQDVEAMRRCLADPARRAMADDLDRGKSQLQALAKDLKNWVQTDESSDGPKAQLFIDERRADKRLRIRYLLEEQAGSWLITQIGPSQELPEHIPYNTHVSKTPEGP